MATLEELQRSQEILEIRKETAKALGDEKELQEILLELQKTKLQIQLDGLEAGEKQTALQEQLNAISQQQVKSATSLGQSMREAFSALSEGNTATGQIGKSLADVAKNGLNVASALKAVRDITLAAVVETDKLRAEYVKLTGDVSDAGKAFKLSAITRYDDEGYNERILTVRLCVTGRPRYANTTGCHYGKGGCRRRHHCRIS